MRFDLRCQFSIGMDVRGTERDAWRSIGDIDAILCSALAGTAIEAFPYEGTEYVNGPYANGYYASRLYDVWMPFEAESRVAAEAYRLNRMDRELNRALAMTPLSVEPIGSEFVVEVARPRNISGTRLTAEQRRQEMARRQSDGDDPYTWTLYCTVPAESRFALEAHRPCIYSNGQVAVLRPKDAASATRFYTDEDAGAFLDAHEGDGNGFSARRGSGQYAEEITSSRTITPRYDVAGGTMLDWSETPGDERARQHMIATAFAIGQDAIYRLEVRGTFSRNTAYVTITHYPIADGCRFKDVNSKPVHTSGVGTQEDKVHYGEHWAEGYLLGADPSARPLSESDFRSMMSGMRNDLDAVIGERVGERKGLRGTIAPRMFDDAYRLIMKGDIACESDNNDRGIMEVFRTAPGASTTAANIRALKGYEGDAVAVHLGRQGIELAPTDTVLSMLEERSRIEKEDRALYRTPLFKSVGDEGSKRRLGSWNRRKGRR